LIHIDCNSIVSVWGAQALGCLSKVSKGAIVRKRNTYGRDAQKERGGEGERANGSLNGQREAMMGSIISNEQGQGKRNTYGGDAQKERGGEGECANGSLNGQREATMGSIISNERGQTTIRKSEVRGTRLHI
jgi:hypothetical protein